MGVPANNKNRDTASPAHRPADSKVSCAQGNRIEPDFVTAVLGLNYPNYSKNEENEPEQAVENVIKDKVNDLDDVVGFVTGTSQVEPVGPVQ